MNIWRRWATFIPSLPSAGAGSQPALFLGVFRPSLVTRRGNGLLPSSHRVCRQQFHRMTNGREEKKKSGGKKKGETRKRLHAVTTAPPGEQLQQVTVLCCEQRWLICEEIPPSHTTPETRCLVVAVDTADLSAPQAGRASLSSSASAGSDIFKSSRLTPDQQGHVFQVVGCVCLQLFVTT